MKRFLLIPFLSIILVSCGESTTTNLDNTNGNGTAGNTVNTEKLIGSPFEGKTTGDDFAWGFFLCNPYRTTPIDTFPIKIFAAFFTSNEEASIQEGINIANMHLGRRESRGDAISLLEIDDAVSADDLEALRSIEHIRDVHYLNFDAVKTV